MPTTLTVAQTAVAQQIIQYGQQNGFTSAQQQTAVKAAFIESSLGVGMQNPGSTAQGLFGYTVGQWAVSGNGGSISSNSDQIAAFYGDVNRYTARFNALPSSTTDGITVDEYIYVKHHDGTNATDFSDSAPGISIWSGTSFTAPANLFTQQHGDISDPSSIGNLAQLLEPQLASNGGSLPTYDPTAVSDSLTAALAADGGQLSGTPSLTSSSKLSFASTSGDQYLASRDGTVTRLTSDASGNPVALNFSGGTLVGNVTFAGTNGHATLNGDGTVSATTPQGSFSYDLTNRTVADPNTVTTTISDQSITLLNLDGTNTLAIVTNTTGAGAPSSNVLAYPQGPVALTAGWAHRRRLGFLWISHDRGRRGTVAGATSVPLWGFMPEVEDHLGKSTSKVSDQSALSGGFWSFSDRSAMLSSPERRSEDSGDQHHTMTSIRPPGAQAAFADRRSPAIIAGCRFKDVGRGRGDRHFWGQRGTDPATPTIFARTLWLPVANNPAKVSIFRGRTTHGAHDVSFGFGGLG